MAHKRRLSIRTLLAFLGMLAALPAFAVIWRFGGQLTDTALEKSLEQVRALVSSAESAQEHVTGEVRGLLHVLARMPAVRNGDAEASRELFRSILDKNPLYDNLVLLSPSGAVVSSARPHSWVRMSERRHVREALAAQGFAPGEYIFSPSHGGSVFHFAMAVLDNEGQLSGVLTASLRLDPEATPLTNASFPKGVVMSVLDHAGIRMLRLPQTDEQWPVGRPADSGLWEAIAGQPQFQSLDMAYSNGERWIISSQALRLSPGDAPYMYIVAGIPREVALAGVLQGIYATLGAMSLIVVLGIATAMLFGELTIVRRLGQLTRASGDIAAGTLSARVPLGGPTRELADLAEAFDAMARALERRDGYRLRLIRALRASRRRFKDVAGSMSDWIWEIDAAGRFTFVSGRVRDVLGYNPDEMVGRMMYDFLIPGEKEKIQALLENAPGEPVLMKGLEVWHETKDGRRACMLANGVAQTETAGAPVGYRGVCVDVTDQKAAEERLLRSLGEKEVLLKEVHHRVKNNLQIISSLMSLESQEYPDVPEVEAAFSHMRGRVRSIALIHQQLYDSGNFAAVEMAGYVADLARSIQSTHSMPGQEVHLRMELARLHLPLDQALPLSLAINEMVTNSFKHAFGQDKVGEIVVRLDRDNGNVVLDVSDSGRGLAPEVVAGERHGLGFQLITALADQLGGTLAFPANGGGARIRLEFPREATAPVASPG